MKKQTRLVVVAKAPRKRASPGFAEYTERFHMRLSEQQHKKLLDRGGAAWLRQMIDREP